MKPAILLAAVLAAIPAAHATVFELTFSGTYTMAAMLPEGSLFGIPATALPVPYSYRIVYDTALDTNPHFFPVGSLLDGRYPVGQPFYGYSGSGILEVDIRLGAQTWSAGDVMWLNPSMTIGAELWFDTDLDLATPTNSWIRFQSGLKNVQLGSSALMGIPGYLGYLPGRSEIWDYASDFSGSYFSFDMVIQRVAVAPTPDAVSPLLLIGFAFVLLAGIDVRRRQAVRA